VLAYSGFEGEITKSVNTSVGIVFRSHCQNHCYDSRRFQLNAHLYGALTNIKKQQNMEQATLTGKDCAPCGKLRSPAT
jgi:hypothetical protein